MVLICLDYFTASVSSQPNVSRFLIQRGGITKTQSVDFKQLFSQNEEQFSVVWSNEKDQSFMKMLTKSLKMTLLLLLINFLIFLFSRRNPTLLREFMKINDQLACGEVYRLMTSLFFHADLTHLFCTSLILSVVGPEVTPYHHLFFLIIMS